MSEVRLQLKKAIPIIVVTWILSAITTLALVYIPPILLPKSWHEVETFSGSFQERVAEDTDSFHISSDHWRIRWHVDREPPPPEEVEFFFIVNLLDFRLRRLTIEDFRAPEGHPVGAWLYSLSGTEYITGSGEFAIRVVGARLEWEIIVEAYY